MRIAHLIYSSDFQRLEATLIPFIKQLKKMDVSSSLLIVSEEDSPVPRSLKDGIDITHIKKRKKVDLGLIGVLGKLISDQKADIIHTHNVDLDFYAGLAAFFCGKKAMLTQYRKMETHLASVLWKMNKAVVCSSQYIKNNLLKYNKGVEPKISVIYNGFNVNAVDANRQQENNLKWRKALNIAEDSFVIGNIGNFIKEEDQASIIKGFRKVYARKLNAHVILCGRGPLQESLAGLAERFGLKERIKIIDPPEPQDVDGLFDAFNCFILSTSLDGRSELIFRAMQAGKPVITTNVFEYPELVDERKSGIVVQCGFPERIDSAIMRLNAINGLADQFGQAGRARLEELFTISTMAEQYKLHYGKILHP